MPYTKQHALICSHRKQNTAVVSARLPHNKISHRSANFQAGFRMTAEEKKATEEMDQTRSDSGLPLLIAEKYDVNRGGYKLEARG